MSELEDLRKRMSEVLAEYLQLDAALRNAENHHFRVCIFGSARIQPDDPLYNLVYELAEKLAHMGIDVVTGGGPGLMEAANRAVRDAHEEKSWSFGLPIEIPGMEEPVNPHLDIKSMHSRFSSRLDEFMRLTDAVIAAPGGIGTILELFYVWQLLQLAMIEARPLVLIGREYWSGLIQWIEDQALANRLVSPKDMQCIQLADTPDEAIALIEPAFRKRESLRRAGLKDRSRKRQSLRHARRSAQSPVVSQETEIEVPPAPVTDTSFEE
jgi:uncharacterized protein (TIGR00730 family)